VPGVYDYAHADITRSYNSVYITDRDHEPKVSLITRSIFFLRPDEYIVVFDRVTSIKPEFPKRWLLHSVYRPELDGTEAFDGVVPYSKKIPGNPEGVRMRGNKRGGISESRDTSFVTIRGWNFGPSDGRLLIRTLIPEKHITRVVGGSDLKGIKKAVLIKPYNGGDTIFVQNAEGFEVGDFVYVGETTKAYSYGNYGSPSWPVEDVLYQGWGKVKSADRKTGAISMWPYRYGIPNSPVGATVMRSDRSNDQSFEFMDAEYHQWSMRGESVANAGPFHMQHGTWRVEVEPIERDKEDIFLHVMLACDKETLAKSQAALRDKIKLSRDGNSISLEMEGRTRTYKLLFKTETFDARIIVTESGKTILNNQLTRDAIKARAKG